MNRLAHLRRVRQSPGMALAAVAIGGLVLVSSLGDYRMDAEPAMSALLGGHVGRFLQLQPLMGSFALLARAPFALAAKLAGAGELGIYRAGVVPCLVAPAALGLALVRGRAGDKGVLLVPLLAVLTPASLAAVRVGHPEEALAAALSVGAVLLAPRRTLAAAIALGLAVATKQWALLAVAPVFLATPRGQRLQLTGIAGGIAALLTLPLVAGSFSAFTNTAQQAATAPSTVSRATVWFLAAHPDRLPLHLGPSFPATLTIYNLPAWIAQASHPLIVVLSPLLALALWRRRVDPLALLALVFLLRCVLDPVDNEYYHLPLLLALLAYETRGRRDLNGIPAMTLFASLGLWLTFDVLDVHGAAPALTNAVYLSWTAVVGIYLVHALGVLPGRMRLRRVAAAATA